MRSKWMSVAGVGAVAALAAAGCGSSNNNSSSSSGGGGYGGGGAKSTASAPAGGGAAVVAAAKNPKLGELIVNSKGFTLYDFHKDKGGKSACNGACASVWPPLTTSGQPTAQMGVKASLLGTTKRSDGSEQVTYAGHPIYTYVGDKKPGDAKGNDFTQFGGQWYALKTNGQEPSE